jgi:hypothetical protein
VKRKITSFFNGAPACKTLAVSSSAATAAPSSLAPGLVGTES